MAMKITGIIWELLKILLKRGNNYVWIEIDTLEETGFISLIDKVEQSQDGHITLIPVIRGWKTERDILYAKRVEE